MRHIDYRNCLSLFSEPLEIWKVTLSALWFVVTDGRPPSYYRCHLQNGTERPNQGKKNKKRGIGRQSAAVQNLTRKWRDGIVSLIGPHKQDI